MSERAKTRAISAAIEYERAKRELQKAERELIEAAVALRLIGLRLNPEIMETSGPDLG